MKTFFRTVVAVIFMNIQVVAQQTMLSGVVTMSNKPVARLTIFTNFGECSSDDLGRYNLPLQGCGECKPGDKLTIFTYSSDLGSSVFNCVISNDYTFNFSVTRKPSYILVNGMIQEELTHEPLPNIEVSVIAENGINTDAVKTDARGLFRIPVALDQVVNQNAVRLLVRDSAGRYRSLSKTPELVMINTFNVILMQNKNTQKLGVSAFTKTKICFTKGNIVTIEASGLIHVGPWVGKSDPDGREYGVFGITLERYSIDTTITTSALMYRLSGDERWKFAGKRRRFIAERDGCLEFEVNDKDKSNNYGEYEVEVTIAGG
jgi:hypothetical protein